MPRRNPCPPPSNPTASYERTDDSLSQRSKIGLPCPGSRTEAQFYCGIITWPTTLTISDEALRMSKVTRDGIPLAEDKLGKVLIDHCGWRMSVQKPARLASKPVAHISFVSAVSVPPSVGGSLEEIQRTS